MPTASDAQDVCACLLAIIFFVFILSWGVIADYLVLGSRSASGWNYDISLKYTCLQFNGTTGLCDKWQQTGEIKRPTGGCFPGDVMLMGEAGPVAMQDLSIGDRVLGLDVATGLPQYSSVRGWLHRSPSQVMNMVEIWTQGGGKLVASPGHMLAVASQARADDRDHTVSYSTSQQSVATYVRASQLRPGDILVSPPTSASPNATLVTVESTRIGQREGVYAPLTWQSNFFVAVDHVEVSKERLADRDESVGQIETRRGDRNFADSSAFARSADTAQSLQSMVLAHSFANIAEPQRYEAAWHGLLTVADLVLPSALVAREDGTMAMPNDYVHPLARLMMRLLGAAPMEPVVFEAEVDVIDSVDVAATGGRRLETRRLAASPQHQDYIMLLFSVLQTMNLPPWMANGAVAPDPPMNDFTHDVVDNDDDDSSGTSLSTSEWVGITILSITILACICLVCCMIAYCIQRSEQRSEEEAALAEGELDQMPPEAATPPPQNNDYGYGGGPSGYASPGGGPYSYSSPGGGPYGYASPGGGPNSYAYLGAQGGQYMNAASYPGAYPGVF